MDKTSTVDLRIRRQLPEGVVNKLLVGLNTLAVFSASQNLEAYFYRRSDHVFIHRCQLINTGGLYLDPDWPILTDEDVALICLLT